MKDLTAVAEGDVVLARKLDLWYTPVPIENVDALSEERMRKKRERYERCIPVAHDILEEARVALAVRFRFLDRALWRMPLVASFDIYGIASDGVKLYYDPEYVVDRFKISLNEVVRDVAHCLFHCIFRHPFMLYSVLRQAWDVSCDIAIEAILLDLLGEAFPCNMDRRERDALKLIRAQMEGVVTAERLYRFFCGEGNKIDLVSLRPIFLRDMHGLWYGDWDEGSGRGSQGAARARSERSEGGALPETVGNAPIEGSQGESEASADFSDGSDDSRESRDDREAGDGRDEQAAADAREQEQEELAKEWEAMSRRIQAEVEATIARRGSEAGNLVAALAAVNRETYDYADFLRRFSTLHERMRTSPDEFDYIYYMFGLNRYGNMPLIEPLEYREDRSVRDFVIAIDTSESVSGKLVQGFMRKTYNILKQAESFQDRVNVHIVQCDAKIQEDTKITSLDQLDSYMQTMELKGFGGTDFRPVFEYVNLLIEKHEFADLKGLVYFTDGQGVFPSKQPAYDSVFVFLDDGYSDPPVPPWAFKVILDEKELEG